MGPEFEPQRGHIENQALIINLLGAFSMCNSASNSDCGGAFFFKDARIEEYHLFLERKIKRYIMDLQQLLWVLIQNDLYFVPF